MRTKRCGDVTVQDVGQSVVLTGWVEHLRRVSDRMLFIVLRDSFGEIQVTCTSLSISVHPQINYGSGTSPLTLHDLKSLPLESTIAVRGEVARRPSSMVNPKMATGELEILAEHIDILSVADSMPYSLNPNIKVANEELRLRYRYLELRRRDLQRNLRLRAAIAKAARDYLSEHEGFIEVETPTLFKPTPEGAREFLVTTRYPGRFYALPQSPQQYKQLLMVGGVDRYFQLARCYRDEDLRTNRMPEFTQLDLELSFVTQDDILALMERLLVRLWAVAGHTLTAPFPRMTFTEALEKYGSDKPDLRYDWQLVDVTPHFANTSLTFIRQALNAPATNTAIGRFAAGFLAEPGRVMALRIPGFARFMSPSEVAKLQAEAKVAGGAGVVATAVGPDASQWDGVLQKHLSDSQRTALARSLNATTGDMLLFAAGRRTTACGVLGRLRAHCAMRLVDAGELPAAADNNGVFRPLWVVDFPLFTVEDERVVSTHHPFTAPHIDDLPRLWSALRGDRPELLAGVRAQHYDIVINGVEVGGGSVRIHSEELQRKVFEEALGLPPHLVARFEHLLTALKLGCPPHGGIALGFDRMVAMLCGTPHLKDVVAFPKSLGGNEVMTGSPAPVTPQELCTLGLQLIRDVQVQGTNTPQIQQ